MKRIAVLISSVVFCCSVVSASDRADAARHVAEPVVSSPIPNPARMPLQVFEPPTGAGKVYSADPNLPADYVEHEYLVSGLANIYGHDADGRLLVEQANQFYTTRILVRHPRDRAKYSGVVIYDLMHPESGQALLWAFAGDYVPRNGDAYVQVTTRREARNPILSGTPGPIAALKLFDPVRYGPIVFPDGGLTWDIISQVARLIKSNSPDNPLREFRPKQIIAGGWSGAGALTLFYINEGFADHARLPGGKPIIDGYLVGEPSWYPRVNSTVPPELDIADNDPRQPVQPRDVPAISLYSMGFVNSIGFGRVRPDSDARNDRYRLYVVPGTYHAGRRATLPPGLCAYPKSSVPLDHYFALTLDHLKGWSRGRVVPPRAKPLKLDASLKPVLDANGNPLGGVRSTALDVPIARYFDNTGAGAAALLCQAFGAEEKFTPEKLRALYGSERNYVRRVAWRALELHVQGWLPLYAAEEVIRDATTVRFDSN